MSWAAAPASCPFDGTPAVPAYTLSGGPREHAADVGRGTRRDQREAVSVNTGLVPKHHPRSPRPPPQRARRRKRRTTRPAREPSLTGPCPRGGEPAAFRMATEPGTNAYRDRPGRCPRHSRPALASRAAGVRMCVGCGSSVALGQESRLLLIASRVATEPPSPRLLSTRDRGEITPHRSRQGGLLSLDSESLMWVRRFYSLLSSKSRAQHPRTCRPDFRRWSRIVASVQPTSSRASARMARRAGSNPPLGRARLS